MDLIIPSIQKMRGVWGAASLVLCNYLSFTSAWPNDTTATSIGPYIGPGVPTGVVKGDYNGTYRPQVHFSPPKGFMNDPNGLHVDHNGTWHLYYQLDPTDVVAGNQHWGHATSPDLYHWTNQPIAIYPPNNTTFVYSGSAVIDVNNTSGFFPDQTDGVVAIYTLQEPNLEVQAISYSKDGGYTFTPYEYNPIIDIGSPAFRDPKVVWYQDHWVMSVSYATDFVIGIYTSYDLKNWDHSSNISHVGLLGLQYECPNLVQVPVWENGSVTGEEAWVLLISIGPGAPRGGTITQYIPGSFDGWTFTPFDSAARLADWGKDNYAGQFFYGTNEDEAVSIAWASDGQYTNQVPTGGEGWRSTMSLPRKNYLTKLDIVGWDLISKPYDLSPVLSSELSYDEDFGNKSVKVDYNATQSKAIYFSANFSIPDNATFTPTASMNFTFSTHGGSENVTAGYFFGGPLSNTAWLDRSNTNGYGKDDPSFNRRFTVTTVKPAYSIYGVIDRSIMEFFIDDGVYSATMLFYPTEDFNQLDVVADGLPYEAGIKLAVWNMSSVWN